MKLYILALIIITAISLANDYRECGTTMDPAQCHPVTDAYVITVVNTFECSYADFILGLDYVSSTDYLLFTDNKPGDENLFVCEAADGTLINALDMPWDTPDPFGVADYYPAGAQPHCNDFNDTLIRFGVLFDGSYYNHYDDNGRGMDCDGIYIWEAYGPLGATYGACLRMYPDGMAAGAWNLPGITTQLSGLTTFLIPGSQGIAVTAYQGGSADHYIWFYEFTGSSMILLGSAQLPSCYTSYGLAYADSRDTYFWSWRNSGGTYFISELEIIETTLQRETWGAIKASF